MSKLLGRESLQFLEYRLGDLNGCWRRTECIDAMGHIKALQASVDELKAKLAFSLQSAQQNGHERDCLFQALKNSTFYCDCPGEGRIGQPIEKHSGQCKYRHAVFHLQAAAKTMDPLRDWLKVEFPELSLETTSLKEKG